MDCRWSSRAAPPAVLLALIQMLLLPASAAPVTASRSAGCVNPVLTPPSGALPPGEVGKPYGPVTIKASNGSTAGHYAWSGDYEDPNGGTAGFPPGLSTDPPLQQPKGYGTDTRTLEGTPTKSGHYSFYIDVFDWPEYPNDRATSCSTRASYTLVVPAADLAATQTVSPAPARIGEPVTFTVHVANVDPNAQDDATGTVLTDTLPTGVEFLHADWTGTRSDVSGGCSETGTKVTCDLGTIDGSGGANTSADAAITVVPERHGLDVLVNQAAVKSDVYDPHPANNLTTARGKVLPPSADLAVSQAPFPDPVKIGAKLEFRVHVKNAGPDAATGVSITDKLPADTDFVEATAGAGDCSETGGRVTCDLGTLGVGKGADALISVMPRKAPKPSETNRGARLLNDVTAKSDVHDPDLRNNSATAGVRIERVEADLSLHVTPDRAVRSGDMVTISITVSDLGPNDADNVTVDASYKATGIPDLGPPRMDDACQSQRTDSGRTFQCDLGTLERGKLENVHISVRAGGLARGAPNGHLAVEAFVYTDAFDPQYSNNHDRAAVVVKAPA